MNPAELETLIAKLGAIIVAGMTMLYGFDQAIKRLKPPQRRSSDQTGKELKHIVTRLDGITTSLHHSVTLQNEVVANLRDDRQRSGRITETLARIEGRLER